MTAAAGRAAEAGTLACAAQLLGAGRALLELSVQHARQRAQFGRPIGSFQAVKHRLADVAIALEFARPLVAGAAAALTESRATAARDTSAAKVAATDAARLAARAALQVHGAIGYTQELDLHLWLTKVQALANAWGSQASHRARRAGRPGGMPMTGMELTSEQVLLRDAVRGLLASHAGQAAGPGERGL